MDMFIKSPKMGEILQAMQLDFTWERREKLIRKEEFAEGKAEGKAEGRAERDD